jgi:ATP-dependent protease ClpP protease subunit
MPKEILLYGAVDDVSSSEFIQQMEDASADDITIRINCNGGVPEYGWGMIAKVAEHANGKKIKVDGQAYSFGTFFLCYVDDAEALDVSEFLIHRASYSEWFESTPEYFTDAVRENLVRINASLEKAFRNKVDVPVFEQLKGVKVKDIFSMDSRIDVFFSAAEAKKIGLIKNIVKITPAKKAEIDTRMAEVTEKITAKYTGVKPEKKTQQTNTDMTLAELKANHPALYAQVLAEGVQSGIDQERERVEACLVFNEIDPVAVKTAIESGKPLSPKQMAELSLKSFSKETLKDIADKSAGTVTTTATKETEKTEKDKKLADFEAETKKALKTQVI